MDGCVPVVSAFFNFWHIKYTKRKYCNCIKEIDLKSLMNHLLLDFTNWKTYFWKLSQFACPTVNTITLKPVQLEPLYSATSNYTKFFIFRFVDIFGQWLNKRQDCASKCWYTYYAFLKKINSRNNTFFLWEKSSVEWSIYRCFGNKYSNL